MHSANGERWANWRERPRRPSRGGACSPGARMRRLAARRGSGGRRGSTRSCRRRPRGSRSRGRPGTTCVTPRPTASTMPAGSWPRTQGGGIGKAPSSTWRSLWQTPVATVRTSTSRGPGLVDVDVLDGERRLPGAHHGGLHRSSLSFWSECSAAPQGAQRTECRPWRPETARGHPAARAGVPLPLASPRHAARRSRSAGSGRPAKAVYALGDFTANLALSALSLVYVSYYLTQVADLRPALAGLVPLIARGIDAFADPLVGRISDATTWKRGPPAARTSCSARSRSAPAFALLWWDMPGRVAGREARLLHRGVHAHFASR